MRPGHCLKAFRKRGRTMDGRWHPSDFKVLKRGKIPIHQDIEACWASRAHALLAAGMRLACLHEAVIRMICQRIRDLLSFSARKTCGFADTPKCSPAFLRFVTVIPAVLDNFILVSLLLVLKTEAAGLEGFWINLFLKVSFPFGSLRFYGSLRF